MGLRKILTYKDPALHKVCRPVEKFDWRLHKLLNDMTETLAEADGVGLAAPQRSGQVRSGEAPQLCQGSRAGPER